VEGEGWRVEGEVWRMEDGGWSTSDWNEIYDAVHRV
jgi:hypothetical protein